MKIFSVLSLVAGLLLAACGGPATPTPLVCGGTKFEVGDQVVLGYNDRFSAEFFSGFEGVEPWVSLGVLLNTGEYINPPGKFLRMEEGSVTFLQWEDLLEVQFSLCGGEYHYRVSKGGLRPFEISPTPRGQEA